MTRKSKEAVICQNCGKEAVVRKTRAGADSLASKTEENVEALHTITSLINMIEDSGYLDVDGIVRRWIPSQCLSMVFSDEGFHESLKMRGYDYSWKVLVDELRKQTKLHAQEDIDGFRDRNRWFKKKTACAMAEHYYDSLRVHVDHLPRHTHEGDPYVKLQCWMNHGKGVHIYELSSLFIKVKKAVDKIKSSRGSTELNKAVTAFNELRKQIKFTPSNICVEFANTYKAAGAYYTIKDLIMFEGCLMQVDNNGSVDDPTWITNNNGGRRKFVQTQESLEALERKAEKVINDGVSAHGYMMLGLLKDFLSYNNFNMEATVKKWREKSELRKAFRTLKRSERRSRK